MEGFGAYLKREREMRGVSLREISQATKISISNLEALEEERFEALGGEIFVRGFLRSYARYMGLDPEEAVLRYQEECEHPGGEQDYGARPEAFYLANDGPKRRWPVWAAAASVVAALFAWISWGGQRGGIDATAPRASYPVEVTTAGIAQPVTGTPSAATEAVAAVAEEPAAEPEPEKAVERSVRLLIHADSESWVKVASDDDEAVERVLPPGFDWRLDAVERIELITGNAGGITLTVNGRKVPKLGGEGQVRRRIITAEGVQTP